LYAVRETPICQKVALAISAMFFLARGLLKRRPSMQPHEPERPGVTPITLVVGRTITYCLWIERSGRRCGRLTLRCDSDGNVFAAISGKEVCNEYTQG
jgi:hypothetical protein